VVALEHLDGTISGTYGAAPVGDCATHGLESSQYKTAATRCGKGELRRVTRPDLSQAARKSLPCARDADSFADNGLYSEPKSHPDISLATQKEDVPFRCEPAQFWVLFVKLRIVRAAGATGNEQLGFDTKIGVQTDRLSLASGSLDNTIRVENRRQLSGVPRWLNYSI